MTYKIRNALVGRSETPGFSHLQRGISNRGLLLPNLLIQRMLEEQKSTESEEVTGCEALPVEEPALPLPTHSESVDRTGAASPMFQIFDPEQIERSVTQVNEGDKDKTGQILPTLELARHNGGKRAALPGKALLPQLRNWLGRLAETMPNFAEAADVLAAELALSLSGPQDDFRVTPILLYGTPGIGKTRFASKLGNILDVGFEKIAMGAASGAFELSGVHQGWGTTRPGRIAKILAQGTDASPVVLLDELDKTGSDQRFPTLAVLLDLLEGDSARTFRDECLEMTLDASRIIFIATANDLTAIPEPLQSRMKLIEVTTPTAEQRLSIVQRMAENFAKRHGVNFALTLLEKLAEADIDLRKMQQILRQAAGRALMEVRDVCESDIALPETVRSRIGFI